MNKMIKKIELDLGGKVISLTPEQAKNLKDALDDLFGKKIVKTLQEELKEYFPVKEKEYVPYPVPYPTPYRPYYWEWQPYYHRDTITCEADTVGAYSFDNNTLRLTG